jgi:hypothetical protein
MAVGKMTNFVLLPLVISMLTPVDMGVPTLLQLFTSVVAILLIAGVQHATSRIYYDDASDEHRAAVATAIADGVMALVAVIVSQRVYHVESNWASSAYKVQPEQW